MGRDGKNFSVRGVKEFLRSNQDCSDRFVFKWSKWVPKKCYIFMWRLGLDRLPTGAALRARNCVFGSSMCTLCGKEEETVEHLFCSCEVVAEIWYLVSRWCKCPPIFLFSVKDLFDVHRWGSLGRRKRKVLKGISDTVSLSLLVGAFGRLGII